MLQALKRTVTPAPATYNGRRHARFPLEMQCEVVRWGRTFPATTRNISLGGVCVDVVGMGSSILETDVVLLLPEFGAMRAETRWSHKRTFGLKFSDPIDELPDLKAFIEKLEIG